MASKRIRIRLYRVQDYDLITLYYDNSFGLRRKMEEALISFANGRPLPSYSLKGVSPLPKPELLDNGSKTKTGTKFVIVTTISIPEREKAAIDLLDGLASGDLANSFLKMLVRRCFMDVEYLFFEGDVRDRFKDPGNAISSKNIVVQQIVKNEAPKEVKQTEKARPAKAQKPAENVDKPETGASSSGSIDKTKNVAPQFESESTVSYDELHADIPAKDVVSQSTRKDPAPAPKPSSAASLFSMADSYNY